MACNKTKTEAWLETGGLDYLILSIRFGIYDQPAISFNGIGTELADIPHSGEYKDFPHKASEEGCSSLIYH